MKRLYILSIMALMLVSTNSAQAGWFGTPDAKLTTKGASLKLPYFSVDLPFPSVTLGTKEKRFTIGPNGSSKKDKK
jgi:hypothetical protein